MLNGKVISTTLLSTDTYSAMTRIVRRGTKKVTTVPATTNETKKTTTNQNNKTQNTNKENNKTQAVQNNKTDKKQ